MTSTLITRIFAVARHHIYCYLLPISLALHLHIDYSIIPINTLTIMSILYMSDARKMLTHTFRSVYFCKISRWWPMAIFDGVTRCERPPRFYQLDEVINRISHMAIEPGTLSEQSLARTTARRTIKSASQSQHSKPRLTRIRAGISRGSSRYPWYQGIYLGARDRIHNL